MLLWAFSKAGFASEKLFDAATDRMLQHGASTYGSQGLSMVAWAFATARIVPRDSGKVLAEAAALQVDSGTSTQAIVTLLWSFATLK